MIQKIKTFFEWLGYAILGILGFAVAIPLFILILAVLVIYYIAVAIIVVVTSLADTVKHLSK